MTARIALSILLLSVVSIAQTSDEEFEYNRHLAATTPSYQPKTGFVPDNSTATAIAYAIALPIFGKKDMDEELPLRARLKDGVWTILGTMHCKSCVGGTLVIQIDKASGKVIFLTHTQ